MNASEFEPEYQAYKERCAYSINPHNVEPTFNSYETRKDCILQGGFVLANIMAAKKGVDLAKLIGYIEHSEDQNNLPVETYRKYYILPMDTYRQCHRYSHGAFCAADILLKTLHTILETVPPESTRINIDDEFNFNPSMVDGIGDNNVYDNFTTIMRDKRRHLLVNYGPYTYKQKAFVYSLFITAYINNSEEYSKLGLKTTVDEIYNKIWASCTSHQVVRFELCIYDEIFETITNDPIPTNIH